MRRIVSALRKATAIGGALDASVVSVFAAGGGLTASRRRLYRPPPSAIGYAAARTAACRGIRRA
ncbi:hypothetical protein D2E22_1394 [Bifidobacterium castoris]|uniref:Uncharacterized protein n=1 Tax=Bifidobacterium castoris TaxID=2306972 RepID=A0A430F736_9BIFI|nr:hypothetical protein D2E22_1394 [Bifidobacterium castoris]